MKLCTCDHLFHNALCCNRYRSYVGVESWNSSCYSCNCYLYKIIHTLLYTEISDVTVATNTIYAFSKCHYYGFTLTTSFSSSSSVILSSLSIAVNVPDTLWYSTVRPAPRDIAPRPIWVIVWISAEIVVANTYNYIISSTGTI